MKIIKHIFAIIGLGILVVSIFGGCDEFQSEEYSISDFDATACNLLQDSTSTNINTKDITTYNPVWLNDVVEQHAAAIMDTLQANGVMIADSDTNYSIRTPGLLDTNYVCLTTEQTNITVFVTDYVTINMIGPDGSVTTSVNSDITMEAVYGCPDVLTRLVFNLESTTNLMQIIKTDQTVDRIFRFAFLPNN